MRQLWINPPPEAHDRVAEIVRDCAESNSNSARMIVADVANDKIDTLLHELEQFERLEITYAPTSTVLIRSPVTDLGKHLHSVTHVSLLEIYIRAVQSISSWRGFLAYSAISGSLVWMALLINSPFVLVAGILISPFAGPAMTSGMGTSIGDRHLILSGVARYCAGLAAAVGTASLLSFVIQLNAVTPLMIENSNRSSVSIIAPLAAGLVGALHLALSERNSLVPTAAVGATVAATLAPPAVVVGMSAVLQRWDLAAGALFFLGLQLFAINAAAALVFWFVGLHPKAAKYYNGSLSVTITAGLITAAGLAGFLGVQFANAPGLQRASRSQAVIPVVQRAIENSGLAHVLQVKASFPRSKPEEAAALLIEASVYRDQSARSMPDAQMRELLARKVSANVVQSGFKVEPYVTVSVAAGFP